MELVSKAVVGESEHAYYRYKTDASLQRYFISNGRLVLEVSTLSESDGYDNLLIEIAQSVEFIEGAPASMSQIIEPRFLGSVTFEEYLENQRIRDAAIAALNERTQTGKTPDDLLQEDAVRDEYEVLLEQHAYDIEQADWLREKLEEL